MTPAAASAVFRKARAGGAGPGPAWGWPGAPGGWFGPLGDPLPRGWQHRVRLHQLYPLAVHAVLFGGSYVPGTRSLLAELAG